MIAFGIFTAGTVFGWYLKTWRMKWLAAKRDFFLSKAVKADEMLASEIDHTPTDPKLKASTTRLGARSSVPK